MEIRKIAPLLVLLAALGCTGGAEPLSQGSGVESAPLELPDLSGRPVRLADYKGKIVLLDFWATWCPPCVEEIPELVSIHDEFKDKGFTVLGVAVEEGSRSDVADFIEENGVGYPILYAESRPKGYKVRALPTAYLIDRNGKLRFRYLGMKDPLEVRRDIETLLKETSSG